MSGRFIHSGHEHATSRYGSHMGTCQHFPALGWAAYSGGARIEVSGAEYPQLEAHELEAKAVAILRRLRVSA